MLIYSTNTKKCPIWCWFFFHPTFIPRYRVKQTGKEKARRKGHFHDLFFLFLCGRSPIHTSVWERLPKLRCWHLYEKWFHVFIVHWSLAFIFFSSSKRGFWPHNSWIQMLRIITNMEATSSQLAKMSSVIGLLGIGLGISGSLTCQAKMFVGRILTNLATISQVSRLHVKRNAVKSLVVHYQYT